MGAKYNSEETYGPAVMQYGNGVMLDNVVQAPDKYKPAAPVVNGTAKPNKQSKKYKLALSPMSKMGVKAPKDKPSPPKDKPSPLNATTPGSIGSDDSKGFLTDRRQQSVSNDSLKTNSSGHLPQPPLSRSTSTMSSSSIASNMSAMISHACATYIRPLVRSRSLPADVSANSESTSPTRKMHYIHLHRRKGKCLRKFCMRFLPPAAACCNGVVSFQANFVAERELGSAQLGTGDKPHIPWGFSAKDSAANNGLDPVRSLWLRDTVKRQETKELYNFFICHTEEDYSPYVAPLIKESEEADLTVFSRSYSLLWGDSQRQGTAHAVHSATFGIVLLSPRLLASYRASWCEKDLDVLFDRTMTYDSNNIILPIYCGGITHQEVLEFYPFLATQLHIDWEQLGVQGIVKNMRQVLDRKLKKDSMPRPRELRKSSPVEFNAPKAGLHGISEVDVVIEEGAEEGVVCTMPGEAPAGCEMRPTSLSLDSEAQQQADCNTTTTSLPGSAVTPCLKSADSRRSSVKKTLRINPAPQIYTARSIYKTDGTINFCCHCGQMSNKHQYINHQIPSDFDAEEAKMEALHRAEMGEVSNHEAPGESEDEEALLEPDYWCSKVPAPLHTMSYKLRRELSILLDPPVKVGSDFRTLASEIGCCAAYIRYLAALDMGRNSPFEELTLLWQDVAPDITVGDLVYLLHRIARIDAATKILDTYHISDMLQ